MPLETERFDAADYLDSDEAVEAFLQDALDTGDAGEVARRLAVPANTMSAHLGVLARSRLVSAERRSRTIIYRAEASPDDPRKCWIRREEKHAMRTLIAFELMEKPALYPALIVTVGSIKAGFYICRENSKL
jgi:DNA-binding phage protein